jgi:hypothetical protein
MISKMTDPVFEKAITIRTSKIPRLALDRVVADLKSSDRVRWKNSGVSKEAVINAIWLWIGDMDPATVEEAMSRYVPRLEAVLRGEPEPEADEVSRGEPPDRRP